MKKLIYLASICLAMAFASCDDFLTVSSPDQLTTDKYWRNLADAESGMASVYSQLYHGDGYATSEVRWPVEAYRTDLYNLGTDATNYETWTDLYKFTYTNGNTQFSYYYQDLYRGINFANQVLEYVPNIPESGISEAKRNELLCEAHFMRGYYHLMLLLNWEKIIIRDKYITNEKDLNMPLSERTTCWDFVIDELQQGTGLPATRPESESGRATAGAAYAYLGFSYLTRAYEESDNESSYLANALQALNEVKGYELVSGDNLVNMFNGHNKNCKESIFEIQYSLTSDNGARYYSYVHKWMTTIEVGGYDEILPNDMLMDEYMKEGEIATTGRYDSRLYNTIYYQCDYFNDNSGRVYGKNYDDWFRTEAKKDENGNIIKPSTPYNRPVFRKFTPINEEERAMARCAFNIPLMRYANVMLMKAEVLNKQGHPEQAIPLINEIRQMHGDMPPMKGSTQAEVQAQIEHERIVEFPLESYRWYDLRRWGKIKEALQAIGRSGFDADKHTFYPIPLWEINANSALK